MSDSSGEAKVIHWGGNHFVVDGDNELSTLVDGYTRDEWLDMTMDLLERCLESLRRSGSLPPGSSDLVDLLVANKAFERPSQAKSWLRGLADDGYSGDGLRDLLTDTDIIDGPEIWRMFDDPAGKVDLYAQNYAVGKLANQATQLTLWGDSAA